ncbi:MAG: septation protein A [Pseudomonadota bacterium]|nr:septation protein A [Pseudomonadota bacterium]
MTKNTPDQTKSESGWVKPATDYGPLVVFLVAYYRADLFTATAALMAATAIALVASLIINGRVPIMPVITAVVVGIFGGLTLIFNDDTFIKIKPTIVQTIFAAILLGGLLFGKPLLKPVMGSAWPMTDRGWHILTRNFGFFFLVMAIVNEIVWRTQTEEFWVNFKVWGSIGLMLVFSLTQAPLLNRYKVSDDKT